MAKHSDQPHNETQVSYTLHTSELRLSRFMLQVNGRDLEGEPYSEVYYFDDAPAWIGKREEAHVTIFDETVSREHCEINREGDSYVLCDLDSTNGTFIKGLRVKQVYLEPGLIFTVGSTQITFDYAQDEVPILPAREQQLGKIIGADVKMREIFSIIKKLAPTDTTVIIEGETGTGKDVVAQTIHEVSPRAQGPFVVVDCSAIPQHLIESELFGHEKGSFTGAIMARKGLFEQADGGTIFLDELGELSLDLQPKLLRVLESRKIRRLGCSRSTSVDVRVIAATNRCLEDEVKTGRFRQDLFYRLSVVRLFLPPLRDRIADLPLLLRHFLYHSSFNQDGEGKLKITQVNGDVLQVFLTHHWPGNIRELLNVIERACAFADSDTINVSDLPHSLQKLIIAEGSAHKSRQSTSISASTSTSSLGFSLNELELVANHGNSVQSLTEEIKTDVQSHHEPVASEVFETFKVAKERWLTLFERDYILTALKRSQYNISHAAREAEIDRKYFRKLMNKYEIELP